MSGGPIFVAGLERTGTSLMYALLASHPRISMTRRTNFWRYFADQFGDLAEDANLDECLATMRVYKRFVPLELDYERLREDFRRGDPSYARLFALAQDQVACRAGKPRWGDKSLNTERWADRILADYPGARILHMIRDPRDRLASVLTRWERRKADVGAGTAAWIWSADLAQRNRRVHGDRYRVVRYESLVADPETEVRAICRFIGEDFVDEMLTMSGAGRFRDEGANSSYGARPVGVIAPDSVARYTEVLSARQVAYIQSAASRRMAAFGYEIAPVSLASTDRFRLALLDQPVNRGVTAVWHLRERLRNRRGRRLPDYRIVAGPA